MKTRIFVSIAVCLAAILASTHASAAAPCGIGVKPHPDAKAELACLEEMARGPSGLSNFSFQAIDDEHEFRYEEAARVGDVANARIVVMLIDEMERRDPPKGERASGGYSALMLAGDLRAALAEARRKNIPTYDWEKIALRPATTRDPNAAHYWSFSNDGDTLSEHEIDLRKGSRIIVYAAPGCGRCAAAAKEIPQLAELSKAFAQKSVWVSFPDVNFSVEYYGEWRKKYPDYPTNVILDRSAWPEERLPATPYFVFMKDGVVKAEIIGWYGAAKVSEFKRALMQIED